MRKKLPALVSKYRAWNKADRETVRKRYMIDGPRVLMARLGRSFSSITHLARDLGVANRKRRWSDREDKILANYWGERSVLVIARMLGRSMDAVYDRGDNLKLGLGCPRGSEYLTVAAKRAGYMPVTLRRIMRWANMPIRLSMSRPTAGTLWHRHCVDPADVDEAVRLWCEAETPQRAAGRLGTNANRVRRALLAAGIKSQAGHGRQFHVPSNIIDAAVANSPVGQRTGYRRWTAEEVRLLKRRYPTEGAFALAGELQRSPCSIARKAMDAGVRSRRHWSQLDDLRLIAMFKRGLSRHAIGRELGREDGAVRMRIQKLGLAGPVAEAERKAA